MKPAGTQTIETLAIGAMAPIQSIVDPAKLMGFQGADIGIVLEYIENIDYRTLYPRFTHSDIRYYTKELLKALEFAHDLGVMHRDLRLIGWSSAEFYQPGGEYDCCVGLNKPPEILLSHERYDCSVDMWCLGNMLASMIFKKDPFFHGHSLLDQLVKISKVLGTEKLYRLAEQLDIVIEQEEYEALGHREEKSWVSFVDSGNEHLATREGMDLVDRLLRFDPRE
ncbi:hypothetical protein FPOAC1_005647 [Fusarium poae]|uniref:hypothetical protein n=1 Tax=Fusarium poae TaxID=36050 RepID=UPI001CE80A6D|nr:hypothetical protein FPOAC1_005647 [Fusarium poae]KAG8672380.1 hypothetical protein FPOAC1_005647 [Fusarium poae]